MSRIRPTCESGFSLPEALLAAVVLAMAVTAITIPFTSAANIQLVDQQRTLSVSLAQEMMEEIISRPFDDPQGDTDPGPDGGETSRDLFDNTDDYHGYEESPGNIADFAGNVLTEPEAAGLSRHVTAAYVYLTGQDISADPNVILITVEVRYRGVVVAGLSRLVYSPSRATAS